MFFLLLVISTIFTSVATICNPAEYENNGLCCPKCNPGSVVKIPCSPASASTVCVPCVDGTYMDHPNGVSKCLKCSECDTGAGLREVKKCTYTSNTECECKPGYFCSSNGRPCDLCSPHTICRPGQYIKEQGTAISDNVCEDCTPGTFSTTNMEKACAQWTKCSEQMKVLSKQGTKTSDSTCIDKRTHFGLFSFAVCVLFIAILIPLLWRRERNPDKQEPVPHEPQHLPDSTPRPVQEQEPVQESRLQ